MITVVAFLTTAPVGFLAGIGAFDYWIYYISGRPTRAEDHSGHGAYSWRDYFKVNTDHKVIGIQYLVTTFFFFVAGGLMAMIFRAELANPDMQYVDTQTFNGLVSEHAALMIFLFIIPAFAGLANFVVPLMLGAPDMAFPRLNALSYWLLPIAGIMFLAAFLWPGGAFGAGWTGYAPLSVEGTEGNIFFKMGVQWAGASSIMTALNFLVTIITMRAPGMTFWRMPLLVWANFTTSLLVVIATPFIAGSQFFALFDRVMHTNFFNVSEGGYVLGYQHIFWFYSHPAVYIMMLPGFGIISEVIAVMSRKPIFGYRLMALSLMAILVLGFSVWAHHMFVAGMAPWLRVPMMVTTMIIAVPTGIKIFSWLATMWEGKLHFRTPMLFALGFLSMFVLGGLSGIFLASVPIDIHASDTYFIVAHIHYVLFGGSVFTIFAGIYYWFPKMTGRMYNERLGKIALLAHLHRLQRHVLPDALGRAAGDAAPGGRLLGAVRQLEPRHLDVLVPARRLDDRLLLQHDRQLDARPDRAVEPVACAHARVAGQLAAAGLQLRPDPAGGRRARTSTASPAPAMPFSTAVPTSTCLNIRRRGRPSDERRTAQDPRRRERDADRRRAARRSPRQRPRMRDTIVVVIAPVNAAARGLRRLRRHASRGRRPAARPDARGASRGRDRGARARRRHRSRSTPSRTRSRLEEPDEVIVSTHPERRRAGCGATCRRDPQGRRRVPVEHVVVDLARTGAENVLVIANETVLGEPLLDRIREKARSAAGRRAS